MHGNRRRGPLREKRKNLNTQTGVFHQRMRDGSQRNPSKPLIKKVSAIAGALGYREKRRHRGGGFSKAGVAFLTKKH